MIPALIRKFYLAELLARRDYDGILRDCALFGNTPKKPISAEIIRRHLAAFGVTTPNSELRTPNSPSWSQAVTVQIWGTGNATREFFYVEDAAEAITMAAEKYNKSEPVNIGAGFEISIKDLVYLLIELMEFKGTMLFDTEKPDGQPRRMLDTTRAYKEFSFKAKTTLKEGLEKTIKWYRNVHQKP